MRSDFFKRTFRLVVAGVALGLVARWMFGVEAIDDNVRRFEEPLDPSVRVLSADIPLDDKEAER